MKNKIRVFILFLFIQLGYAQDKQVIYYLQDIITKKPIQNANITFQNSSLGTVSNDEGAFQLESKSNVEFTISHLEYKKYTLKLSDLNNDSKIIYLEQNTLELEDVVVTKEPIEQLLLKAINSSKAKFNKPIVLNTYYREFVKVNDKYTRFTDGLIDFHMNGNAKKTDADLIVNQSRAAKLISEDDETLDLASGLDVRNATTKQYNFYNLEKILFDSDNYEDYDFELKSKINKSGTETYIINFQPKVDLKKYLYKGTVVFDPNTYLISDLEIASDQANIQYTKVINILIIKASLLDLKLKSSFKVSNGNYLLSFTSRKGKLKIWNKKKYNEIIEYKSDLVVTDYKKDDLTYNKKSVYNDRSLYERGNQYTDKFWLKNNSMVLTDEEQQVITRLEQESSKVK
jgi:hypothetical protein